MSNQTTLYNGTARIARFSLFDSLRKVDEHGNEYWSARDLQTPLGYEKWQDFKNAIERARVTCSNIGQDPDDHFMGAHNMVSIGSGAMREAKDYHLTKYAAFLTAMNGDNRKPEISAAQTYFAISTMQYENAKLGHHAQELTDLKTMLSVLQHQITEAIQLSPPEQAIKDCLMHTGLKLTAGEIKINCMSLEVKRLLITVMDKLCDDMALRNTIRRQNPIGNQTAPRFFF